MVGDEPYAAYSSQDDLPELNSEYLDRIDSESYRNRAAQYSEQLQKDPENEIAAIDLRATYHHAMEDFIALTGAYLQAPEFPVGWIVNYKVGDLRMVAESLNQSAYLWNVHGLGRLNWKILSELIYRPAMNPHIPTEVLSSLVGFWKRCGTRIVSQRASAEYNAYKHGLRLYPSKASLLIEAKDGGKAEFKGGPHGTASFVAAPLNSKGKYFHFVIDRVGNQWDPQLIQYEIQLLATSVDSLLSALRQVATGSDSCDAFIPDEALLESYSNALANASALQELRTSLNSLTISAEHLATRPELLKELNSRYPQAIPEIDQSESND